MKTSLLYGANADIKYPLSDFHEEDIPNDILLDLSLTVPFNSDPILACLRVGIDFVFMSLEEKTTGEAIGSVLVRNPEMYRVYPLAMDVEGYGWAIFGPYVKTGKTFYIGDVEVALDPECVLQLKNTAPVFNLTVNGFIKELNNILGIRSTTSLISVTSSSGIIFIDRDATLSGEDKVALTTQDPALMAEHIFFTIAGNQPDTAGNLQINVDGCVEVCPDHWTLRIPRGDIGEGEAKVLPLDTYGQRTYLPGDKCAPVSSSSLTGASSTSAEECQTITVVAIQDPKTADNIGLYFSVAP